MNYQECQRLLGNRTSLVVDNNTKLLRFAHREESENDITVSAAYAIRLHQTDVLTFKPNATTVNSGGFRTRTTKDRINQFGGLPLILSQRNGEWQWYTRGTLGLFAPFHDGDRFEVRNGLTFLIQTTDVGEVTSHIDSYMPRAAQPPVSEHASDTLSYAAYAAAAYAAAYADADAAADAAALRSDTLRTATQPTPTTCLNHRKVTPLPLP